MDLLPQSKAEFASADYWEQFFKKRGAKAFEWYGEYPELCGILHKYVKTNENVLMAGCGNSQLSADMYDVGYRGLTNIDISENVIRQMTDKNVEQRPDMKFLKMDITKTDFEDGQFGVVIDKGTLDALMPDTKDETISTVNAMFSEISRVLHMGGRYICVSLAQEHILSKVLEYFAELGWMLRVHRLLDFSESDDTEYKMPVFVYVCTKFKKMPNMSQILEICLFDDKAERLESLEQVKTAIKQVQQYGYVRQYLNKRTNITEHLNVDLYSAKTNTPRYTLHIVDSPKRMPNKFAIFIVPEGRETEWLFSTDEGRAELAGNAGFERLVVVTFHRDQEYSDIESVKAELSSKVMELAPPRVGKKQVPFLSIGEDIGSRVVLYQGNSQYSGEYVVEDVDTGGTFFRRLVFLSNRNVVQSEAKLVPVTDKKGKQSKKSNYTIDQNYLSCAHHRVMIAGLAMLKDFSQLIGSRIDTLLVGLGGGGLPLFIHKNLPNIYTSIAELDSAVLSVAENWFNFCQDDRLQVHIADGLDHIKQMSQKNEKKHVVMLDVDSKDNSVGMSCPPQAFVEVDFLRCIDDILHPDGVFILNFVCRNKTLRETVISQLKTVFGVVQSKKVPEEINEIVLAYPSCRDADSKCDNQNKISEELRKDLRTLQEMITPSTSKKKKRTDIVKLTEQLNNITLL